MITKFFGSIFNSYTKPWLICILASIACAWFQLEINLIIYKLAPSWQNHYHYFHSGYFFIYALALLIFSSLLYYIPSKLILMLTLGLSLAIIPLANIKFDSTALLYSLLIIQILLLSGAWLSTINLISRWLQAHLGSAYSILLAINLLSNGLSHLLLNSGKIVAWDLITITQIISGAVLYGLLYIVARDKAIKFNLKREIFEYDYYSLWQIILRIFKSRELWLCIYYLLPSTLILSLIQFGVNIPVEFKFFGFSVKQINYLIFACYFGGFLITSIAGWCIDQFHIKYNWVTAISLVATIVLIAYLLKLVNGVYDYLALSFILGACLSIQTAVYGIINDNIDPKYNSLAFGCSLAIINFCCAITLPLSDHSSHAAAVGSSSYNLFAIILLVLSLSGLFFRPLLKPALFQRY